MAALVIANKYEEVYGPTLRDFEAITAGTYSRNDILKMERVILKTLDFGLTVPTTITFLNRYIKASNYGMFPEFRNLAQYLCEWSLLSNTCLTWAPSQIAAGAVYACFKAFSLKRTLLFSMSKCLRLVLLGTARHDWPSNRVFAISHGETAALQAMTRFV